MRRVTLLLSGVPQHVKLPDLSYCLDRLFNTDEIGTFKTRDLPNNPVTNKRQIALDFISSFDAMAAQEKLEGYKYEMEDGRLFTLRAKINKAEEYMCCESRSPERLCNSGWGTDSASLSLIPSLDGELFHRANARLDAELNLLRKQQLVIENQKKLLREKNKLKKMYGSMVSSFCQYQVPSRPWMEHSNQCIERYDESETSSSKDSRSRSRENRPISWHRKSKSREQDHHDSRRRGSRERGYRLPQIEWHNEERAKNTGHRSRSKDRTSSHEKRTRDQKSGSKEPRDRSSRKRSGPKELHSRRSSRDAIRSDRRSGSSEYRETSKEQKRSKERVNRSKRSLRERNHRELRCMSRERMARSRDERSRSRELQSRSRERQSRSRERRTRSRERRTRSRERQSRSSERQSRSRERQSRSRERRTWSRDRRTRSRDRRIRSRERQSRSRERRTGSSDRRIRSRERQSRSRARRSRSFARRSRSKERSQTHRRSCSRERAHRYRRSTSKERDYRKQWSRSRSGEHRRSSHEQLSTHRRSRSRDLALHSNDRIMSRYHRRSSSSERKPKTLAIMPKRPRQLKSPIETIVSYDDDYKSNIGMQSDKGFIKIEKNDIHTDKYDAKEVTVTKKNKSSNIMDDTSKKPKSKEKKRMAKFNSTIKTADILESRVKEFTKDVMILIIILLEEFMKKDKVRISASNKVLLIKKLETLIEERVEPLARNKKSTDIEVLRRYKKLYPREVDLVMIKQILDKIPKIAESQSTVSVSSEDLAPHIPQPVIFKVEDIKEAKDSKNNVSPSENIIPLPCETQKEHKEKLVTRIKKERIEVTEKPIIIDINSAEKPVPRHPQFVVVIKSLMKMMKKVGLHQLLQENNLTNKHFHYALRHMLRQLLKSQGYVPRQQIITKFRDLYPQNQDEEFVKNVIKDIKDGTIPRCMDRIYDITDVDCPDDPEAVVLIEKQQDVVTVADSDDDEAMKPITELSNVQSVRGRDMPELSSENFSPNKPSPANAYAKPIVIELDYALPTPGQNIISSEANRDPANNEKPKQKHKKKKNKKKREKTAQSTTQRAVVESTDSQETRVVPDSVDDDSKTQSDKESAKGVQAVDAQNNTKDEAQTSHDGTEDNQVDNGNKTEKVQEYDTKNQVQEKLNTKENSEENDNNLIVTGITILTSLDDLIAKTSNTDAPETEPINDIKEELEHEEDRPGDFCLQLVPDSGPVVTSITIMTSDAELFSIGQDKQEHKEVNVIKEEGDYDTEESLLNEIETDINNDKFEMNKGYDNSFDYSQIVLPAQNYSATNLEITRDKTDIPQESRMDDEDETIESIGRYVASMY